MLTKRVTISCRRQYITAFVNVTLSAWVRKWNCRCFQLLCLVPSTVIYICTNPTITGHTRSATFLSRSLDSAVGIPTALRDGWSVIGFPVGTRISVLRSPKAVLGPTQPPTRWLLVLWLKTHGGRRLKLNSQLYLMPKYSICIHGVDWEKFMFAFYFL